MAGGLPGVPWPDIHRMPGAFANRSRGVIYGGLVWMLATARDKVPDVGRQMADALAEIDAQLAAAGTDRTRVLTVDVYLADMGRKAEMDAAWTRWVVPGHAPRRMTVETRLDGGDLVEVVVLAALPAEQVRQPVIQEGK